MNDLSLVADNLRIQDRAKIKYEPGEGYERADLGGKLQSCHVDRSVETQSDIRLSVRPLLWRTRKENTALRQQNTPTEEPLTRGLQFR